MRTTTAKLVLPALLVLGTPDGAAGQGGGTPGFWRWALDAVRDGRPAGTPVRTARTAPGPAFCRSGLGHPAHGRAWCREKGFALAPVPWVEAELEAVRVGESARPRRFDGRLGARDLRSILGERVLRRLMDAAGVDAAASFLNGRWQESVGRPGARVLQLRVVERPLAEVNDLDADGRADAVLLYRPQR